VAYILFAGSVAATIYSGIKGVLPLWAFTLYGAFAIQLVFMTFMYAIKHSGAEEIRRSLYSLRRERVTEWKFTSEMLAEFARFAFCTSSGLDPAPLPPPGLTPRKLRQRKAPWPTVDISAQICKDVRSSLESKIEEIRKARDENRRPDEKSLLLELDFIAYSAETLIVLSREITAEIDDILQASDVRFDGHVSVRVLIRDTTESSEWLVPLAVEEDKDIEYAADLRTRFRNVQRSALREFHEALKDILAPKQVDFRVRGYRVEPLVKGVLVDGSKGLFGLYTVSPLKDPDGWDYSGHAVTMCPCDVNGDFVQSTARKFLKDWFDMLWSSSGLTRSLD